MPTGHPEACRWGRAVSDLDRQARCAYGTAAHAWATGAERVYRPLAAALLDAGPASLQGLRLLDVGAGTGVVGDVATHRGARCVEVDVAVEMLAHERGRRRVTVVADGRRLPFPAASFDVVTAACSLSHVADPVLVLADARRVLEPGGWVLASAFSQAEGGHPARMIVDAALRRRGWTPPAWYREMQRTGESRVDTAGALVSHAHAAGLRDATADVRHVHTGVTTPGALVEWRLGVAQYADFLGEIGPAARAALRDEALAELGPHPPPLVRQLLVLSARR